MCQGNLHKCIQIIQTALSGGETTSEQKNNFTAQEDYTSISRLKLEKDVDLEAMNFI